jgi:hypothetical protein
MNYSRFDPESTIEFSRITPRLFNGFEMRDGFNLALPEKALLDTIYLRRHIPFHDELYLDNIDRDALMSMADSFPATVRKHLIELMEDA